MCVFVFVCLCMYVILCQHAHHTGKLILATVSGIAHRRPRGEELDQANPVRNEDTQLWQCPFCQKNEFPELSEVRKC